MFPGWSDDPVMDAERYYTSFTDREHLTCAFCGRPIYREDKTHYGDVYYEIDGVIVCDDCVMDYIEKNRKEFC